MPYKAIADLPETVQKRLPKHAQEIYLSAYNNAWQEYRDPKRRRGRTSREATAHRVAWAAVEKIYRKDASGAWRKREN